MNKSSYSHISHDCIKPFINKDSQVLILGSFPSVKTRELGFYYGHKQNRFYKVLASIFNEDVPLSVNDKKEFLDKHNIALYDVIYECDIIGSSDSSIKNPTPINLSDILNRYPNIKSIILNGGLAKKLFDKYLLKDVSPNIKIYYCSSTSPANAKMKVDDLVKEYRFALQLVVTQ